ncbi:MAG: SdpI family protein [Bacteroidota bacterium]
MGTDLKNAIGFGLLLFGILIVTGIIVWIFSPKKINHWYGYRTPKSMKSIENWNIANAYSARVLVLSSLAIAPIYFVLIFYIDLSKQPFPLIAVGLTILIALLTIILTERKLKRMK